jgi:hypothetical protein
MTGGFKTAGRKDSQTLAKQMCVHVCLVIVCGRMKSNKKKPPSPSHARSITTCKKRSDNSLNPVHTGCKR